MARLTLLPLLLLATACASQDITFPRNADLIAVTQPKPPPPPNATTSAKAAADHSAAIETWGDRIHAAGVRLCHHFKDTGMRIDCPPVIKE